MNEIAITYLSLVKTKKFSKDKIYLDSFFKLSNKRERELFLNIYITSKIIMRNIKSLIKSFEIVSAMIPNERRSLYLKTDSN